MAIVISNPPAALRRHLFLLAVLVFATTIWIGAASAANFAVGSVLALRGEVFRDTGTSRQPLGPNDPIYLGDVIVTGAGKAKVTLNDGSIVSLGENTRLRLLSDRNGPVDLKARLNLVSGALRVLVTKISAGGQFEVETETAIAAVRGTDWLLEAREGLTSVAVVTGIVAVFGRDPVQTSVLLNMPGQGTDVRQGQPPTPPKRWGQARFYATLARATF